MLTSCSTFTAIKVPWYLPLKTVPNPPLPMTSVKSEVAVLSSISVNSLAIIIIIMVFQQTLHAILHDLLDILLGISGSLGSSGSSGTSITDALSCMLWCTDSGDGGLRVIGREICVLSSSESSSEI